MKTAAACGVAGPIVFAAVAGALTGLEWDFMRSLGWDPAAHLTRDWPSGLALGPLGAVMTAAFVACGLMLAGLAAGRFAAAGTALERAGAVFLALAGLMMALLASPTDPSMRPGPPTIHGRLHDAAFAGLGVALLASFLLSGLGALRAGPGGRTALGIATLLLAALALPAFSLKGAWFVAFLAAILAWCETAAVGLLRRALTPRAHR